jgi:hypothetical protein
MEPFVVQRSAWRMWGVSLLGVPMVVFALDILTQQRLTEMLRNLLFKPEDTQLTEPREDVWAVVLLIVGLILCVWGLKELLSPSKVVVADSEGIAIRLRGPGRRPFRLAWSQIEDIGSATVEDDGTRMPVLWVRTVEPGLLPADGWGARPMDDRTLAVLASDWEMSHVAAAEGISAVAVLARAAAEPEVEEVLGEVVDEPVFDPGEMPDERP